MILEFTEKRDLIAFLFEVKKAGMLKDLKIEDLSDVEFPVRIPIKMDGILKIAENPIIRKAFGKKIESVMLSCIEAMV